MYRLFSMPIALAFTAGFIQSAISPTVLVTGMLELQRRGYGEAKSKHHSASNLICLCCGLHALHCLLLPSLTGYSMRWHRHAFCVKHSTVREVHCVCTTVSLLMAAACLQSFLQLRWQQQGWTPLGPLWGMLSAAASASPAAVWFTASCLALCRCPSLILLLPVCTCCSPRNFGQDSSWSLSQPATVCFGENPQSLWAHHALPCLALPCTVCFCTT